MVSTKLIGRFHVRVCLNLPIIKKRLTRLVGHSQIDGRRLERLGRSVPRVAFGGVITSNQTPVLSVRQKPKHRITRFQERCRSLRLLKSHLLKGNEMVSIVHPNGRLMLSSSVQKMKMV
jgi:hypothetical protein